MVATDSASGPHSKLARKPALGGGPLSEARGIEPALVRKPQSRPRGIEPALGGGPQRLESICALARVGG